MIVFLTFRAREEELVYILERLSRLELDEGVFEAAFSREDAVNALRDIKNGKSESSI